jgi:hypothetical protein
MGELQERITSTKKGSITSVQAIYVPADDYTDPAPATTFAHLDATTNLSRAIAELGIYPAVDPLASTSRILDPRVIGDEHYNVARGEADPAALQGPAGHHRHPRHRRAVRRGQADRGRARARSSASCRSRSSSPSSSPASRASTCRSPTPSAASRRSSTASTTTCPSRRSTCRRRARARRADYFSIDGRQQKLRGQVNGNVLVPLPSERTPLTAEASVRPIVERFLAAYPAQLPNRPDIDPRALNTNAPQFVDTNSTGARWDLDLNDRSRLALSYQLVAQHVDAFQLVAGQNPDTDTHSHAARATWRRDVSAFTSAALTAGFDRVTTFIRPEPNAVGPTASFNNFIAGLGPAPPIPIVRATNRFRYGAQTRHMRGDRTWDLGVEVIRHQNNGKDQDGERGIITFSNDFGRDAIANLRHGTPTLYTEALGDTWRGYRHFTFAFYGGGHWRVKPNFTIDYGLRYEPVTTPVEVNSADAIPYPCDCNNLAPRFGFAWRLPGRLGQVRSAYGIHYGEIFATTFGQVRLSPPGSYRVVVGQPSLANPLGGLMIDTLPPNFRSGHFLVSPDMVTPYSHQYNFSWEPDFVGEWKLQLAYVGSRTHKLFQMWFDNRARPIPGIPQTTGTINQRRTDPTRLEVFRLLNASRGYYDAGRVTLLVPRRWRFSGEVSYWFSKALDLGNDYTSTLSGVDARLGRSQSEDAVHADLKGRSSFDQTHAGLLRGVWDFPELTGAARAMRAVVGGWSLSSVLLLKNGTPFSVDAGSDAPGFGNVDGQGGDRVHVVDPGVLGRTIGNPDRSERLLPRSAFAFIAPTEERGNIGRNTFRRGKIANVNAALARTWRFSPEHALEFRAESRAVAQPG